MFPYWLLVGIPFLVNIAWFGRDKRKNRSLIFIFFILYFLLLALRSESIGIDLTSYKYMYTNYGEASWNAIFNNKEEIEVGFAIFCKLIYSTNASFHTFIVLVAVIEIVPLAILYCREIEDAFLTIVLFLNIGIFSMLFSGLRQSIAVSLGAIAFLFLKNRKFVLFVLTVFLATTFHTSAFMLIFMLPLYYLKITKRWLVFVIPLIVFIMIFKGKIFSAVVTILPDRYSHYEIDQTGAVAMLLLYCLFAIYSYMILNERKAGTEIIGLRNFLLFSVILQIFASVSPIAMRMNYYYIIFIPLLIPKVIKNPKLQFVEINGLARSVMLIFFSLYFFYGAYNGADILQIYPYEFFWSK